MELLNATKMIAGYAPGMLKDGRELLVVVVKGTFDLPRQGEVALLAAEQLPLIEADIFVGEPGLSAPFYESDYSPVKPFCDVILNGKAYAPGGQPVREVGVGVKVGRVAKAFHVVGDRVWQGSDAGVAPGTATPFVEKAFSYDVAFGGTDRFSEDESEHDAYMANPNGVGYRKHLIKETIDGMPVPSTEERKNPVQSPTGDYVPMSLGPVGRSWPSRASFAGTYDDAWLADVFPFLPEDFDTRYFQCAPEDQQTDHLRGGEGVTLVNLTPDGRREFQLPRISVPITFFRHDDEQVNVEPLIDTLYFEPGNERFSMTWRANLPLKQNLFEVSQIVTGKMSRAWWRARALGKTYYPGLAAVARSKSGANLDDAA